MKLGVIGCFTILLLALSACGGGSSSSSGASTPSGTPAESSWDTMVWGEGTWQ
ncbi:hypothetical protein [Aurantivibrio plasticivorans]